MVICPSYIATFCWCYAINTGNSCSTHKNFLQLHRVNSKNNYAKWDLIILIQLQLDHKISLSLLCFYYYFLISPHYSIFIPMPSPIIPILFLKLYYVSHSNVNTSYDRVHFTTITIIFFLILFEKQHFAFIFIISLLFDIRTSPYIKPFLFPIILFTSIQHYSHKICYLLFSKLYWHNRLRPITKAFQGIRS